MKNLLNYFDLNFRKVNAIMILLFVLCIVAAKVLHITEIPENSLLENLQLVALFAGFVLCFRFKNNKALFNFAAMIIFLMVMRELSYGRCIFCQLPDDPHNFYPWSHYKYGFLAHVFVGIYIAASALYAIINKVWIDIKEVITKAKFPVWDFAFMGALTVLQIYGESVAHNSCLEEIAEFMLYSVIFGFVYYYYKKIGMVA